MARVYANLVRNGIRTLEEVPQNLRQQVQQILEEDSMNEN